jgi:hypothetical protein
MLACTLAYSLWLSLFPLVLHHLSLCCLLYYIMLPTCASSPFALTVALLPVWTLSVFWTYWE